MWGVGFFSDNQSNYKNYAQLSKGVFRSVFGNYPYSGTKTACFLNIYNFSKRFSDQIVFLHLRFCYFKRAVAEGNIYPHSYPLTFE